jgi:hypothetical protein
MSIIYSNVVSYAFDDEANFWALSKFGYLKLAEPAREYDSVYLSMQQAVRLWYYIQDNKKKPWVAKDWAKAFAKENSATGNLMTIDNALKALAMHADFIFPEMKKEGGIWNQTEIFKYMKTAAPFAAESRKQRRIVTATSDTQTSTPKSLAALDSSSKRRGRPRKAPETEIVHELPTKEEALPKEVERLQNLKTDAAIVWKLLRAKSHAWNIDEATKLIYAHFQFDSQQTAGHYMSYQAENLLKYMRRGKPSKSNLYKELSKANISPKVAGKMAGIGLRARDETKTTILAGHVDVYSSTDEESAPAVSILRPKKSGMPGKRYTKDQDAISEDDTEAAGSKRRKLRDDDEEHDFKRLGVEDNHKSLPLRYKENGVEEDESLIPLFVKTYPIDFAEIDEDGTWHCNQTDCLHIVYGADSDLGRELISMHMEDHEEQMQIEPEVEVVKREMQATHLPVK